MGLTVKARPHHGGALEVQRQAVEGALQAVDDGDGVPLCLELGGEAGPDPTASDDDDVHGVM